MSEGPEPTQGGTPERAIPATYRRAPRTERFILTGVGIGALIGVILGVILPAGTGIGRGTAALLVGIAGALAGGLVAGSQAAFMEYTSGRSADRQRHDIESDWAPVSGIAPEDVADARDADAYNADARNADAYNADARNRAATATHDDEGAGHGSR